MTALCQGCNLHRLLDADNLCHRCAGVLAIIAANPVPPEPHVHHAVVGSVLANRDVIRAACRCGVRLYRRPSQLLWSIVEPAETWVRPVAPESELELRAAWGDS